MEIKPQYLTRFAELYERQGRRVEIMNNKLWVNYRRMVIPVGPIHLNYSISAEQAHRLMKKIPGSLMVRYSYGHNEPGCCQDWYAVICDNFEKLESFPSKQKWQMKKGLENCEVLKVDAAFIAAHGFDVYLSAFTRYNGIIKPIDRNDYIKMIKNTETFDDIYHYWAVIHNNKLIAYSVLAVYGNEAVDISVTKFTPEYLRLRPGNALYHNMKRYYLTDNSPRYLNAGVRNIYHSTNAYEFLIKNFSFRKVYLNLRIIYNQPFSYFVNLTYPFRGVLSKANSKLKAIFMLEGIRRKSESRVAERELGKSSR